MDKLFESYMKSASKFICEDDEFEEEVPVDAEENGEEPEVPAEEVEADEAEFEEGEEEALELDLANPVCPKCGAKLIPVSSEDIDTEDMDEEEANAIALLTDLGYTVFKNDEEADDTGDEEAEADEAEEFSDEDLEDEAAEAEKFVVEFEEA